MKKNNFVDFSTGNADFQKADAQKLGMGRSRRRTK